MPFLSKVHQKKKFCRIFEIRRKLSFYRNGKALVLKKCEENSGKRFNSVFQAGFWRPGWTRKLSR